MVYVFKDGEENYPGTLPVRIVYALDDRDEFSISWAATAIDKATVANFTDHSYFNLTGDPSIAATGHVIALNADRYLPLNDDLIPTGELRPVAGTPFDFMTPKPLGRDIDAADEQIALGGGYDHHFVLNKPRPGALAYAAGVFEPVSGRTMEMWTTEPGLQLFTANGFTGKAPVDAGKGGKLFVRRGAFCLEPSRFPDGPNKPKFPSTVVRPGEWYTGEIVYRFGTK